MADRYYQPAGDFDPRATTPGSFSLPGGVKGLLQDIGRESGEFPGGQQHRFSRSGGDIGRGSVAYENITPETIQAYIDAAGEPAPGGFFAGTQPGGGAGIGLPGAQTLLAQSFKQPGTGQYGESAPVDAMGNPVFTTKFMSQFAPPGGFRQLFGGGMGPVPAKPPEAYPKPDIGQQIAGILGQSGIFSDPALSKLLGELFAILGSMQGSTGQQLGSM